MEDIWSTKYAKSELFIPNKGFGFFLYLDQMQ